MFWAGRCRRRSDHHGNCLYAYTTPPRIHWLTGPGPFELTKLSAQISVLMADRSDGGGKNDAIRKSYQNLGTIKTAQNLIKHRGWRGLYSGFHLHLRKCASEKLSVQPALIWCSPRFDRHWHLLRYIRKYKADIGQRPRNISHTPASCGSCWRNVWVGQLGMRELH